MARLPVPGQDHNQWGDILNNYLLVAHMPDGTLKAADLIASKYTKPPTGVPRTDLSTEVQDALDMAVSGIAPDATTTSKGIIRLTGDLTGDALSPLIAPGRVTGGAGGGIAAGTITNANIHSSAAIAKTKLAPLAITNDDVAVGAAIVQSKIQGLTTDLAGKADANHMHSAADITSGLLNIARIPTGTTGATVALGNHGHTITDISNLQSTLNAKANTSDLGDYATTSALAAGLATKQNTGDYATSSALTSGLAGKQDTGDYATNSALTAGLAGKANTSHDHTTSEITDFISATAAVLGDRIVAGSNVTVDYDAGAGTVTINSAGGGGGEPSESVTSVAGRTGDVVLVAGDITAGTFAQARIPNLDAGKTTSGTFDIARIPTGTSGTTVALGNHTHDGDYAALSHDHTITDITNLQDELDDKVDSSTLENYATNTDLSDGLASKADASDLANYASSTDLSSGLAGKANTSHTHGAADIISGTFDIARIPTGTSGTTVALGNHTHDGDYAALSHNHDDRYYTETEVDAALSEKLNANEKGVANGVATLDADSKIPVSQLPALAVKDTFTVASQAAMLTLTAQRGDMAIRTDNSQTYVLAGDDASVLGNWVGLTAGPTGVTSYNELDDLPTLGTAAAADTGDFATTAQGALADSAVQPAAIADFETTAELDARDTANRNRANHTGTQAMSTITGLEAALSEKPTIVVDPVDESSYADGTIFLYTE